MKVATLIVKTFSSTEKDKLAMNDCVSCKDVLYNLNYPLNCSISHHCGFEPGELVRQVLFAGGLVDFLGDLLFSPLLMISSAQNYPLNCSISHSCGFEPGELVRQVLFAGGLVDFLGDLLFSPLLIISSAQNERDILDEP